MRIIVNTQRLAQELRLLNKVVPTKPALSVLANVLIWAGDSLTMYATDLEVGLFAPCPDARIEEQGSVTLPAKRLLDIVDQLPDEDIAISVESGKAHIRCGAFHSRLQTIPAEEYPALPQVEGEVAMLNAGALRELISRTRYAISDSEKRFVLNGAQLTINPGVMGMVATDGKRLSLASAPCAAESQTVALIPTKTLDALMAQLGAGDVAFSQSDKHLFFVHGSHVIFSRMIDGKFPAYERIIPKAHDKQTLLNPAPLAAALKRVGLVSSESQTISLQLTEGALHLSTASAEIGDADERLEIGYNGEELKVATNWRHLLDFLEAGSGQPITLAGKGPKDALLLTDGNFLNVVMVAVG